MYYTKSQYGICGTGGGALGGVLDDLTFSTEEKGGLVWVKDSARLMTALSTVNAIDFSGQIFVVAETRAYFVNVNPDGGRPSQGRVAFAPGASAADIIQNLVNEGGMIIVPGPRASVFYYMSPLSDPFETAVWVTSDASCPDRGGAILAATPAMVDAVVRAMPAALDRCRARNAKRATNQCPSGASPSVSTDGELMCTGPGGVPVAPVPSQQTSSGASSFPIVPVVIGAAVLVGVAALLMKKK